MMSDEKLRAIVHIEELAEMALGRTLPSDSFLGDALFAVALALRADAKADVLLTVSELCVKWNMDIRTIDKLVDAGGLGCVIYPAPVRARRFPLSIVIEYEKEYLHVSSTT